MSEAIDWDIDLPTDPDEEYRALVRALRRTQGFGLLFVRCSPAEGTRLIQRVQTDLPQKTAAVLSFDQPITDGNLYSRVEEYLEHTNHPNILFIQGLEHSIYDYEDTKRRQDNWQSPDLYSYSWKGVPRVLMNLNQQRERFRDTFNTCFVFLIPNFVLSYLANRAPDFFDWRSGIFQLPMDAERLQQESQRVYSERFNLEDYEALTSNERRQKILEVQALIDEDHQTLDCRAEPYFEQGLLFATAGKLEEAIAAFDQAVAIKPDDHDTLYNKGIALGKLERYVEAIASYDQVIAIKPDKYEPFYNKGTALNKLRLYKEAIVAFDQSLALNPDDQIASCLFLIKGSVLRILGRDEEAITAFDQSLAVEPDDPRVFFNKGVALRDLRRYEEAISAFDQAIAINLEYHEAFFIKGAVLFQLGRDEEAITAFDQALAIKPEYPEAFFIKGMALRFVERYVEAIAAFDQALAIKPDDQDALNNKGNALGNLGRYEEAIAAYDRALAIKPDYHNAFYNKACCYGLQKDVVKAVEFLQQAIGLNLKYRKDAKTDSDFDGVRDDERFRAVVDTVST